MSSTMEAVTTSSSRSNFRSSNPQPSHYQSATGIFSSNSVNDLEKSDPVVTGTSLSTSTSNDPYDLRKGVVPQEKLSELRRRKKNPLGLTRGGKVEQYQLKQNALIDNLLKPMDDHIEEAKVEEEAAKLSIKIAIYASLLANFCLCVLQLYAAISALSLSILATAIDSVFDIGSNIVLFYVHRKATRLDVNEWPVGGSRLETIANVVYGSLMSSVNLVVLVESVQSIITHNSSSDDLKTLHIPSLVSVGAAVFVKFLLFVYCYSIKSKSSQVEVLWEDHRNDLGINAFALLMSAGGAKLAWWLDPLGAIIIAVAVMCAWIHTIYLQFQLLAGKSAPHEFIKLIIYKVMTFSDEIEKVDTVRCYHSGPEYIVEIDIVMPSTTPLWKAHDVSQQLQDKVEVLPNVGRAFVHVDYEYDHTPEHRKLA